MTNVVNVKVNNIRPKYNNLKEWLNDPNNVYIGRKGIVFIDGVRFPQNSSIWANPFKITKEMNRDMCINEYKKYIKEKINCDDKLKKELLNLKGKSLGCWCKPDNCHGDVLVELIDLYSKKID